MEPTDHHGRHPPYPSPHCTRHHLALLRLAADASTGNAEAGAEALEQLERHVESLWPLLPRLLASAEKQGLAARLSPAAHKRLRELATHAVAAHMVHEQWLERLLEQFEQAQIPVILLKSSAFAHTLYPAASPRVGRDLDLLVQERHFQRASALLEERMQPVTLDDNRPATAARLFERVFRPRNGAGPTVELHRALTNPGIFQIDEEPLWETSLPHPRHASRFVRILSPEHSLLHLAVHAFRDLDFCTHNLLDAHRILTRWRPDPDRLADTAERWGARAVLHCLLHNSRAVLGTPLPDPLQQRIEPGRLRRRSMHAIVRSPHNRRGPHGRKSSHYRLLQILAQWTFPDYPHQGMQYQLSYASMRIGDVLRGNRIPREKEV